MQSTQIVQGAQAAQKIIVISPDYFAGNWAARPKDNIALGLRTLSAQQKSMLLDSAMKFSSENMEPGRPMAAYNKAVIFYWVAKTICDPNNIAKGHELFPAADAQVFHAFTEAGARRIFDESRDLEASVAPLDDVATDAEVTDLIIALGSDLLARTPAPRKRMILRHCAQLLAEMHELADEVSG